MEPQHDVIGAERGVRSPESRSSGFVKSFGRREAYESPRRTNPRVSRERVMQRRVSLATGRARPSAVTLQGRRKLGSAGRLATCGSHNRYGYGADFEFWEFLV